MFAILVLSKANKIISLWKIKSKYLDQNLEVLVLHQLYVMDFFITWSNNRYIRGRTTVSYISDLQFSRHLSNLSNNPEFIHPFLFSLPLQQSNKTIIASHYFQQWNHSGQDKNTNMTNNKHQKPSLFCFFSCLIERWRGGKEVALPGLL